MTTVPAAPPPVPDEALDDLRDRLNRFRAVETAEAVGGGLDPSDWRRLLDRWRHGFDWRAQEARIRALPWELVEGATPLRVVHRRADPAAPVVVLLHGWPDSVLRFERLLPLLEAYTVVVPALPGFPFAAPVPTRGMAAEAMGDAVADALARLGHDRYVLSAGDVGTDVAEGLLLRHAEHVAALHLTDVSQYHFLSGLPDDLDEEERAYVDRGRAWQAAEGGYMHEQSTRPRTLAVGLGDSPAGLLAWIGEKLDRWTDHDGDLTTVFSDDELLTWVSAYWFSGAIGTSFTPYAVSSPKPAGRVDVPTVLSVFPRDLVNAPRVFAQRSFDVREWLEPPRGGHFAAWEQPRAYADALERAVALARR
jgi:pimeloyl-ACP methyl ester carboxylesterase